MANPIDIPLQVKPYYAHMPIVASPFSYMYQVFVDEDAHEKYSTFKGDTSNMVRELQAQGKNLPVLRVEHKNMLFSNVIGTVFDTRHIAGEIFDKKLHTVPFCELSRTPYGSYQTYNLKFSSALLHVYAHRHYPIIDFKMSGKRYRWVYYGDRHWYTDRQEYSYSLFLLDDNQPSLVDNSRDGKVSSTNKLLGSTVKSLVFGNTSKRHNMHADKFNSATKVGQLTHTRWKSEALVHKSVTSVFSIGSDHPVESLADVSVDVKIFLIIALIFQYEEEEKEKKRIEKHRKRQFQRNVVWG